MTRALAAAQTVPVRGDVDANLAQHLRLVDLAARERVRVLVFPELSLTGYELDLAEALAFSPEDPRLAPLVALARAHAMLLVVGAPLQIGMRRYVAAFLLAPDGTVELYTKHHLGAFSPSESPDGVVPPPEASVFQPGDRNPLLRIDDDVAAVAVCADTGRASHPAQAAARGASLYLASAFVIPAALDGDCARFASYATRHAMTVVFSNFGGPSGGLPSGGGSAIWSAKGERLVALGAAGAGIAVAVETSGWRTTAVMLDR